MAGTSASAKNQSFTFRLEPALKAALSASAAEQRKQPAELMRELVKAHIAHRERQAFEEEARRACLVINDLARDPNSDEAQVMRELDAYIEDMSDDWK